MNSRVSFSKKVNLALAFCYMFKCNTGNSRAFWRSVKPMFSHRNMGSEANITLVENGLVLNEKIEVANVFNKYFVSVAEEIGECDELEYGDNITGITQTHATHQSVSYIRQNLGLRRFSPVVSARAGATTRLLSA